MGPPHESVKRILKTLFDRLGYRVLNADRYGLDAMRDIHRIANALGHNIRIFFDVGANTGETARIALREFPSAHIISFEPHPSTYHSLIREVRSDRFEAINTALSDRHGTAPLFVYKQNEINSLTSKAQYAAKFAEGPTCVEVQCTTIDRLCDSRRIDRIDVLKIDTEGSELEILRGAEMMLEKRAINFVYTEFNSLHPVDGCIGGALIPIADLLVQYGLRFVTSYNDRVVPNNGDVFTSCNALFARCDVD